MRRCIPVVPPLIRIAVLAAIVVLPSTSVPSHADGHVFPSTYTPWLDHAGDSEVELWVSAKDMAYYGVGPGLPGTVIFDRAGKVRRSIRGVVDEKEVRELVAGLLAEKP